MKIKKDDKVIVITGKDKGKTGTVTKVFPELSRIIVSGVNMQKTHKKARRSGEKGQVIEKNSPIHVSNVMIVDKETGKGTRIGRKVVDGKKVRIAKKSNSRL
jgi:large subunit ribosomal protein L24